MTREDELILKTEQGDKNALDELISIYYPEILRYCLWHTPNRSLAEDATQETFLKTIRYFNKYVHKGKFRAFLYKIATNICIDIRRTKSLSDISLDAMTLEFSYEEKGFDEIHEAIQLTQLISNLPSDLKDIIILRFGQGLKIREISEITDAPLRTVQSRLRRALKLLKNELRKDDK